MTRAQSPQSRYRCIKCSHSIVAKMAYHLMTSGVQQQDLSIFTKKHAHDDEGRHCVICCVADICTGYCLDHRWYSSKFASGAIWTCKCVAQNLHRVCHGVHKGHSLEPAQPIKGIHAVYLELMLNLDRKLHRIFYGICTNVATNALSVFV